MMEMELFESNFLDLMNAMYPKKHGVDKKQQATKEGLYYARLAKFAPATLRKVAETWCASKDSKGWPAPSEAESLCLEIEPKEAKLVESYRSKEEQRHEEMENAVLNFMQSADYNGNRWELYQCAMQAASIQAQAIYGTGLPEWKFGYDHMKTPFDVFRLETKEQNLKLAWQWALRNFNEAKQRGNIHVSLNRCELDLLEERETPPQVHSGEIKGLKRMEHAD